MGVEGRICLTRLAWGVFFPQHRLSRWERFLAEHRWSGTAVTAQLVSLVGERLGEKLTVYGAYVVGPDTTLVAQSAQRRAGGQKWHDHSGNADRSASRVGPHGNLVGLMRSWGTRWRCWPLVMRLVPGPKGARPGLVGDAVEPRTFWDAAIAVILEVTLQWGDTLVSPDLSLSALQILEISGARFSIALTIRDGKHHCGLGDSQCTTTRAILRFGHLACIALCLWRLALLDNLIAGRSAGSAPELPAGPPGFAGLGRAAGGFCQFRS